MSALPAFTRLLPANLSTSTWFPTRATSKPSIPLRWVARAKLTRHGVRGPQIDRTSETLNKVWPIVMHGDAAFAGQGIWAETLNLADLRAYSVGGTVHIIVNNLIGFTTRPTQEHSSRYASSIARRQSVPIFHVNAEDPDAVVRVGRLAAECRARFH